MFRPLALIYSYIAQNSRRFGMSNNFTQERILPPLLKLDKNSVYDGSIPVTYTNDPSSASEWIERHLAERPMAVGFDVESAPNLPWRKVKYTGPATVQLAVADAALVLQIGQEDTGSLTESIPLIKDVLSDQNLLKTGVGIDQDMLELFRWDSASLDSISGRLDIGGVGGANGRTMSLKNLAKGVLGVNLPKSKKIAMSNWGKAPLTREQVIYAARDAWVAAAVLEELSSRDPNTFSISELSKLILEDEYSIEALDAKAVARKAAKTKLFEIIKKDGERVDRKSLSKDQLLEVERLEAEMKQFAPPRPVIFDIEPLGLGV